MTFAGHMQELCHIHDLQKGWEGNDTAWFWVYSSNVEGEPKFMILLKHAEMGKNPDS